MFQENKDNLLFELDTIIKYLKEYRDALIELFNSLPVAIRKQSFVVSDIKEEDNDGEVYKNSHHNGTLKESVLKIISPKYVVFTTKDGYLPSSSYLSLLKKYGAKYYMATNSKDKNVLITSDGTNIKVKTKN